MFSSLIQFRGELAALGAALIWAIASLLFVHLGQRLSPLVLNILKSGVAIGFILLTLILRGDTNPQLPFNSIAFLSLSGAIGIGFGDTAYFASLNCIGARRALLLEALAPPLTALFAGIFLGEILPLSAWLGISLTVAGVAWVVIEREPDAVAGKYRPLRGIAFGLLAALGQASGAVLSRAALAGTEVSPLWSSLVRLVAGVLVLLCLLPGQRQVWGEFRFMRSPRFIAVLVGTSFASTFLAIWLQQIALKFTAAGIAQSLTSTSPLFVIPVALWRGERVSLRSIAGVLVALGGVWLLFLQR